MDLELPDTASITMFFAFYVSGNTLRKGKLSGAPSDRPCTVTYVHGSEHLKCGSLEPK